MGIADRSGSAGGTVMAGRRALLLLLLLLLTAAVAAAGGAVQQLTTDDVTGTQLGCLVNYLESKGRRTVDIYVDYPVTGNIPTLSAPTAILSTACHLSQKCVGRHPC